MTPFDYVAAHEQRFLDELIDLIRIPSVSTLSEHQADMLRAADFLLKKLSALGFTARRYDTPGHPVVYGEWLGAGDDALTVLVYGHYDVQPAELADGWDTDPFTPTLIDGKLYARGASDDKGQVYAHIKAAEALLESEGALPVNLKFIIEGEEENGSPNVGAFIEAHQDLLAADVIVVSDTHARSLDTPLIIYALRGMSYMELEVRGSATDLHSGTYGGMVHNPAQALCEIVARLHDANGTITVPGFYDRVIPLSDQERAALAKTPYTEADLRRETNVPAAWGEAEYAVHERTGARPTLEVNGLVSGWTGEGAKTVLPAKALAKISCRLVAGQDYMEIYGLVRDYVAQITPPTVTSEVRFLHGGAPVLVDLDTPAIAAAVKAFETGWGATPVFAREGGSIPVVAELQNTLGVPAVLMGFGLPDDGLHGPNEKFTLECYWRGIKTALSFYQEMAAR